MSRLGGPPFLECSYRFIKWFIYLFRLVIFNGAIFMFLLSFAIYIFWDPFYCVCVVGE